MANFGETLKRERELRKISLREVSEATKIGLRYLEAMEENRFDQLPGGLFNKGFIRAYAKFIGLDGETLVNVYLYDVAHQASGAPSRPRYAGGAPEDAPIPQPGVPSPASPRRFPVKLVSGIAATLVVVGAGFWLMLSRPPAGAAIDTPPTAQEPPIQEAGLLRPAPGTSRSQPEPKPPEIQQETTSPLPAPSDSAPPAALQKATPTDKGLIVYLGTTETTALVVLCDGVEKMRRDFAEGETVALSCAGELLFSAENAGALTLKVNGNECLPLGELGAALVEFPLNAKRAKEICPPDKEVP